MPLELEQERLRVRFKPRFTIRREHHFVEQRHLPGHTIPAREQLLLHASSSAEAVQHCAAHTRYVMMVSGALLRSA